MADLSQQFLESRVILGRSIGNLNILSLDSKNPKYLGDVPKTPQMLHTEKLVKTFIQKKKYKNSTNVDLKVYWASP
jgi:hypothetical protein